MKDGGGRDHIQLSAPPSPLQNLPFCWGGGSGRELQVQAAGLSRLVAEAQGGGQPTRSLGRGAGLGAGPAWGSHKAGASSTGETQALQTGGGSPQPCCPGADPVATGPPDSLPVTRSTGHTHLPLLISKPSPLPGPSCPIPGHCTLSVGSCPPPVPAFVLPVIHPQWPSGLLEEELRLENSAENPSETSCPFQEAPQHPYGVLGSSG